MAASMRTDGLVPDLQQSCQQLPPTLSLSKVSTQAEPSSHGQVFSNTVLSASLSRSSTSTALRHAQRRHHERVSSRLHSSPRRHTMGERHSMKCRVRQLELLDLEVPRHSGYILGDPSKIERCDPAEHDITSEELAVFDNVASYSRRAMAFSEAKKRHRASASVGAEEDGEHLTRLNDNVERAGHATLMAINDHGFATDAVDIDGVSTGIEKELSRAVPDMVARNLQKQNDPFLDFHVPDGPEALPETDKEPATRGSLQEQVAMANPWFYVYRVIRLAQRRRLCAWVHISAEDIARVEHGVGDCRSQGCAMRHCVIAKNHEWWVAIMDEDDKEHLDSFVTSRSLEEDGAGTYNIKRWGVDPLEVDKAVNDAAAELRMGGRAEWPAQYMTGLFHGLVIWMDVTS